MTDDGHATRYEGQEAPDPLTPDQPDPRTPDDSSGPEGAGGSAVGAGQEIPADEALDAPVGPLGRGEAAASEIDGWADMPAGHREGPPADDDAVREKGDST